MTDMFEDEGVQADPNWRVSLVYPSRYLSAPDLQGRDVAVKVGDVAVEVLERKGVKPKNEPPKAILTFVGKTKRLVLNKTNATTIARLYGDEMRNWVGKTIILYPTTCHSPAGPETTS